MNFPAAQDYILHRLNTELDTRLVYHSYDHTLDVYRSSKRLGEKEKLSKEDMVLIETAALYHDAGMLEGFDNHEAKSAKIAAEILPRYGYSDTQIETIEQLILSTRLPQRAESFLEQIICDADLDNLGRPDFFINSFKLKLEWQYFNIRKYSLYEWFELQEQFLTGHTYFTSTAREDRDAGKLIHIEAIRLLLSNQATT